MNDDNDCVETENEVFKDTAEAADELSSEMEELERTDVPRKIVKIESRTRHSSQPAMSKAVQRPSRPNRVSTGDIDTVQPRNQRKTPVTSIHGYPRSSPSFHSDTSSLQRMKNDRLDPVSPTNSSTGYIRYPHGITTVSTVDERQPEVRQPKISMAMSLRSLDLHAPPPTPPEDKTKMYSRTLAIILSCIYAIMIVTLGAILSIGDIFIDRTIAEIYCLYLIFVGFIYLLFLLVDIRRYMNRTKKFVQGKLDYENELQESENRPKLSPPKSVEHHYCFSQGRHAGSFYLKIGAACFCLGHLVHAALFLNLEIVYLMSDDDCGSVVVLILNICYPIYSFCQLFFIFKHSNVIILRNKVLGRFALMHCISSSLCFWIWTIVREVMESLMIYSRKNADKEYYYENVAMPSGLPATFYKTVYSEIVPAIESFTSGIYNNCSTVHSFDGIIENIFPYLYPFTIEYSILIVGIFYIIWQNIGHCSKDGDGISQNDHSHKEDWESFKSLDGAQCKVPSTVDNNGALNNLVISVDCHSTNKGWFGGIIVIVLSIVSVIVTWVTITNPDAVTFGVLIKEISELALHLVMLIAAIICYNQIKKLDVNQHPISLLDDLLLFICMPAFFFDAAFSFVPAVIYGNYLKVATIIIVLMQILVQTPLIIDALRRCSNSRELRRVKYGRELITFLIICNVSTWIFVTFSIKNADTDDERYDFYGKALWTILGHISVPLSMFYRFHSSVCLADIWNCAYEPGNSH